MNRSKALSSNILQALTEIVGSKQLKTDTESLQTYGKDSSKVFTAAPSAIILPKTIDQVQAIVKLANKESLALVPSGGRTGLSGAAMATNGELVVCFDAMNKILNFNAVDRTIQVQAGVITQVLQEYAEQQGLYYPVNFASAGSSQIGGNISTNAGGIKVIKYGMTRDWVAGLTVVTGSGELLHLNRELMKNNAGYDLRQLFIGAEGSLGFIVEASMRLTQSPRNLTVLLLAVPDLDAIMQLLQRFQKHITLSAFEFFCDKSLQKVITHTGLQAPFSEHSPFYALLEFENLNSPIEEQVMSLFAQCIDEGLVTDGIISQSIKQHHDLWRLREDISATIAQFTPYKNDISTIITSVPALLHEIEKLLAKAYPNFEILWFGHIGDGNVHLNILKPDDLCIDSFVKQCKQASKQVFEIVQRYGGSISAEHGVGLLKKEDLLYTRSAAEILLMQQIKQVFDPNGIMNPGKIFDSL